jgi:hypothetical protein
MLFCGYHFSVNAGGDLLIFDEGDGELTLEKFEWKPGDEFIASQTENGAVTLRRKTDRTYNPKQLDLFDGRI